MTMRANSQFPQPDLHRQDMRPYGLHAKLAETAKGNQTSPNPRHRTVQNLPDPLEF